MFSNFFCRPASAGLCGLLVAIGVGFGQVHAGGFVDPDPNWVEGDYTFPAPPDPASLRPFYVSAASPNRFLVDESSLTVGQDGVVRYVLVIETAGGARNVSFEGIHCASAQRRIYALGRSDGNWSEARESEWRPINDNSYNRQRSALAIDHFCDGTVPPRNRDEVLMRLRRPVSSGPAR